MTTKVTISIAPDSLHAVEVKLIDSATEAEARETRIVVPGAGTEMFVWDATEIRVKEVKS